MSSRCSPLLQRWPRRQPLVIFAAAPAGVMVEEMAVVAVAAEGQVEEMAAESAGGWVEGWVAYTPM